MNTKVTAVETTEANNDTAVQQAQVEKVKKYGTWTLIALSLIGTAVAGFAVGRSQGRKEGSSIHNQPDMAIAE